MMSSSEENSLEFNARVSPEFLTDWVSKLFSLSLPRPSICACWRFSPACRSVPAWIWFGFFASPRLCQSRFHLRWMRIQTRPLRSHNQTNSRCFLKLNMKYNIKARSSSIHMNKNRKCIEARILTAWRWAASLRNRSRDLHFNGLWFLFSLANLWFWLEINLVVWCWRSRLNHTRYVWPVRLFLRLQNILRRRIVKALCEPVHRKLLHHDYCLCVWGSESIRVQSKTVCRAFRSGLIIYSPVPHHINICMEELTPDRFSIIRPNGSLLKSLHILWVCENLAPACLWEPLAHPAVCLLFKHRWVSEQLDPSGAFIAKTAALILGI